MSKCFLVIGRHRSGTSSVAGVLNFLGICMGNSFNPANHNNAKGFFEDKEFLYIHKKMTGHWTDPKVNFEPYSLEYLKIIKNREEIKKWGIKDPRLCFLLPYFLKLKSCNTETKIIDVCRPIEESAYSLCARNQELSLSQALEICEKHDLSKAQHIKNANLPTLIVNYPSLIRHPLENISRLAAFTDTFVNNESVYFIDRKLRHQKIYKML